MILTILGVPPIPGALLHVYLEDTTYADAPARVLVHETRPVDPRRDGVAVMEIAVPAIPQGVVCTVRAHVDVDGDGAISSGDYITTESYRFAERAVVRVRRIS